MRKQNQVEEGGAGLGVAQHDGGVRGGLDLQQPRAERVLACPERHLAARVHERTLLIGQPDVNTVVRLRRILLVLGYRVGVRRPLHLSLFLSATRMV